jgi:hypothetical protein
MDTTYYLDQFEQAAGKLDKGLLAAKGMEFKTGIWLDSAVLKLQKKNWVSDPNELFQPGPSIFFSVWVNDQAIKESKLLYNIHALKLRKLKGYSIASREFAEAFRKKFKPFADHWPNVSVKFGPLTLMEGWKKLEMDRLKEDVLELAGRFLEIGHLVDEVLDQFSK